MIRLTQHLSSKFCASLQFNRHLSSVLKVHSQMIDRNLELRSVDAIKNPYNDRPLVVLFGWLLVTQKNLNKFGDIYIEKGYDVLGVKVHPTQILLPVQAKKLVRKILNYIEGNRAEPPILFHGFSVGGYLYGEVLVQMNKEPSAYPSACRRLTGQIFDSPVDMNGIPHGMAQVLFQNAFLQSMFEATAQWYLNTFEKSVTRHYLAAQDEFIQNKLHAPSLVLYSTNDPITNPNLIQEVIAGWLGNGDTVCVKCWDDSGHVLHYKKHPQEYYEQLDLFLDQIKEVETHDALACYG